MSTFVVGEAGVNALLFPTTALVLIGIMPVMLDAFELLFDDLVDVGK